MRKLIVKSAACVMAVGSMVVADHLLALDVDAQPNKAPVVQGVAPDAPQKPDSMRLSESGRNAIRAMHAARVAIFDGDPELCEEMLTKAQTELELAAQDKALAKVNTDLLPVDGALALPDSFVPTEKNSEFFSKANQHFQKGESAKGIEQLKLGQIEVSFSRILLPLEATQQRLAEAISLVKEKRFYDANLALKSAGEGFEKDSIALFDFPKPAEPESQQG